MSRRRDLAERSWTHLRRCRQLAVDGLPERLSDPSFDRAAHQVAERGRDVADDLPSRLVDGNIAAAIAGHVIARQHDPANADEDVAAVLRRGLDAAGGHTSALVEVCTLEHAGDTAVFYRRRNCCLRDRLPEQHRCDTCSLRPFEELSGLVEQAIERRRRSDR